MFLSEAIRDWASYSRTIRGYSKQTHRCYLHRQRQFARWLTEEKNLPDLPVHDHDPPAPPSSRDELRAARGNRSQREFAELVGVSPMTIRRWEKGRPISGEHAKKVRELAV